LQSLKQRFIAEIQQMLQGAVRFIEEKTEWVVNAIRNLISAMRSAVKPISISVSLPDWEGLAKEIEEGVAILNAAMKGLKSMSVGASVGAGVTGGGNLGGGALTGTTSKKGKAAGGPVQAGQTYLVGERGRELFTPDRNGFIIPNHKLDNASGTLMPAQANGGTNIVVNFFHQPAISVGTEREARETIAPVVADVVRGEFQKRGI